MNPFWQKLTGTTVGKFIISLTGVTLKNNAGNLEVRSNDDTDFANVSAQDLTLENNTTGFGVTVTTSGSQGADYSLTLPVDDGTAGQVLSTDGTGVLSWQSAGSTETSWKADVTDFTFGSSSPLAAFTLPAGATIDRVDVYIDVAFDTAATMSVGVNGGSASKYVASGDVNMQELGRYTVYNTELPEVGTEAIEVTLSLASATAGEGRVIVTYGTPA